MIRRNLLSHEKSLRLVVTNHLEMGERDLDSDIRLYDYNDMACEDSRTAAQIGLAKVATWTVGKLNIGVFAQRVFHSISSDTWHTKPFRNSQLRRSDGCPFSVELR
ncbi:hypothetical protein AVEN_89101-1 [Araneus ventricosus]|uniref:Uncharacterized protein n=1 Tax=Araneus ventricosus TaxID=182803 RepID=A0A4Y2B1M3_ARAVE|nr:hypothetical protein AVEN_89101-1 [Araneus ventricosus]